MLRAAASPSRPAGHLTTKSSAHRVICHGLKENVAGLSAIDGIRRVSVGGGEHSIENQEGKKASVAIYSHLAQKWGGSLGRDAALEGLELYGEFVQEARQVPGSHPNIDLLLRVAEGQPAMDIVVERE